MGHSVPSYTYSHAADDIGYVSPKPLMPSPSLGILRSTLSNFPAAIQGSSHACGASQDDTHKRRLALPSTKAAKETGIILHGSEEAMEAYALNLYVARRIPPAVNRNRKAGNWNVIRLQGRRLVQNPSREYIRGPP